MEPIKNSGWKTSEFWVTIAALAVNLLIGGGVLTVGEGDQIIGVVGQLTAALINTITVVYYIKRRSDLKEEQIMWIARNPQLCSACGVRLNIVEKVNVVEKEKCAL